MLGRGKFGELTQVHLTKTIHMSHACGVLYYIVHQFAKPFFAKVSINQFCPTLHSPPNIPGIWCLFLYKILIYITLYRHWYPEIEGRKLLEKKPRLWLVLCKYFKWIFVSYGILFLAEVCS